MADRSTDLVWYASYGSNCDISRFSLYLVGGEGAGPRGVHRGARDPSLPRDSAPMEFESQVTYKGRSKRWGGGVAFLEHQPTGAGVPGALGRRYLITWEQFEDVVAQENGRPTSPVKLHSPENLEVGEGWYDKLVSLPPVEGVPVVTFTSSVAPESFPARSPSLAYLSTIAHGLHQIHDLDLSQIVGRLRVTPVVADKWTAPELLALLQ